MYFIINTKNSKAYRKKTFILVTLYISKLTLTINIMGKKIRLKKDIRNAHRLIQFTFGV